tara:strand:- start:623 stop:1372 length:750 start_codon:yes stop_codon:yes gene_type:complete
MLSQHCKLKYQSEFSHDFIDNIQHWRHKTSAIQLVSCEFDEKYYQPGLYSEFGIMRPEEITRSVAKRQADFLAGRYMAKQCLLVVGFQPADIPIINIGAHRSPVWPEGFIGSITHNASRVICALSKTTDTQYLGIDIESIIAIDSLAEVADIVQNKTEKQLLLAENFSENVLSTLIFSAKESLFKALYSKVNDYFGFECARVVDIDTKRCCLYLELDDKFARLYKLNRYYTCWYELRPDQVISIIYADR